MNIRVNIDVELSQRTPEFADGIVSHLEQKIPFVIYFDEDHYLTAYPAERNVVCYAGGAASTNEYLKNDDAFLARIKFAIPAYDKFQSLKPVRQVGRPTEMISIAVPNNLLT